jgi:hypothetical protein
LSLKYRIGGIGWYNFERLVQTLLKVVIGPGVTSFGGSRDGGRDAAYTGAAPYPSEHDQWDGEWVFQAKYADLETHGAHGARRQVVNAFGNECEAILARGAQKGFPDNYLLLTDVPLTARNRAELERLAKAAGFAGNFRAIDGREVCEFLDLFPQIRRSYPQLLGLADLDRIVNRQVYQRSEAYIQEWQPRLATFVRTKPYEDALSTLAQHRFVVLDGPPEAGKSTIAAALALLYAAVGFEVVHLRNPQDVFKTLDSDNDQFFVADDALGSIALDPTLTDDWSRELPGVVRKLDKGHLLVWTARTYILEHALAGSKLGEVLDDFPGVHEVLVEVGRLSTLEKAEIVYNHCKAAPLSHESRALVRERARRIVHHPSFTPERIRQLVAHVLPHDGEQGAPRRRKVTWEDVNAFLASPQSRWVRAYDGLTESEKTLLFTMVDFGVGAPIAEVRQAYEHRRAGSAGRFLAFEECVRRLDHSFLRRTRSYLGNEYLDFQHPSLRDMLLSQLTEDAAARRRYIELASPVGLSSLLQGMAAAEDTGKRAEHTVCPSGDAEVSALISRLEQLREAVLSPREWRGILGAAVLLVPHASPGRTVAPADADLEDFVRSAEGMVVAAVLRAFGSEKTFELCREYSLSDWTEALRRYYDAAVYCLPPPRPQYLVQLLANLDDAGIADAISLASLVNEVDPLIVRQCVSDALRHRWDETLKWELEQLVETGEEFPSEGDDVAWEYDLSGYQTDPSADEYWYLNWDHYDQWYDEANTLLETGREFYEWTGFETPSELDRLESLLATIEPPSEPGEEEAEYLGRRAPQPYWTIERLFEDL